MDERQQSLRNARLAPRTRRPRFKPCKRRRRVRRVHGVSASMRASSHMHGTRSLRYAADRHASAQHGHGMAGGTNHSSYTHPLPSHPFYYQAVDAEAAEASVGALRYRLDGKHAQEEVHTLIRRTQNAHHTARHPPHTERPSLSPLPALSSAHCSLQCPSPSL